MAVTVLDTPTLSHRSVSPISEDDVSPMTTRKSLPGFGSLPHDRHSTALVMSSYKLRMNSSSASSEVSPLPVEADFPVFPPRTGYLAVEASPRVVARHEHGPRARKLATASKPVLTLDTIARRSSPFSLPPNVTLTPPSAPVSTCSGAPMLPMRYREIIVNRKLRLLEQQSVTEDRKPALTEVRRRAISETVRPDYRRLPPTHTDITDALAWIRYQLVSRQP